MRLKPALALGLAAAAGLAPAWAHPHGSVDCAATLGLRAGALAWVDLQLTLDGGATQALRPRVALHGDAQATPQAAHFNRVLWGLLRQSGWMLAVQADPAATAWSDWVDHDSAQLRLDAQGRLQVQVRLQPATPLPVAQVVQVECRDTTWYWLAGFRHSGQLQADGARCEARLGELRSARSQARVLQAAAQQAGAPGADQMDPALAQDDAPRASQAELRC